MPVAETQQYQTSKLTALTTSRAASACLARPLPEVCSHPVLGAKILIWR